MDDSDSPTGWENSPATFAGRSSDACGGHIIHYLLPGDPDSQIRLKSIVCDLDKTTYIYISVGGAESGTTVPVLVDGEPLDVREELAEFFRRCLRDGFDNILVWADDLHWFEFDGLKYRWHRTSQRTVIGIRLRPFVYTAQQYIDQSMWAELKVLFFSPYWNSVEAVIDIIVGNQPSLFWGDTAIEWHMYINTLHVLTYIHHWGIPPELYSATGLSVALAIPTAKYMYHAMGGAVDLRRMLHVARLCPQTSAMSAADMVFTMLAMSSRWRAWSPVPRRHLGMSVQEAFIEIARFIVLDRKDLSIWDYEHAPVATRITGLPSWVPDFSVQAASRDVPLPLSTTFQIWGDYFMRNYKNIRVSYQNNLKVQAQTIDYIVSFSPIFNATNAAVLCQRIYQLLPNPKDKDPLYLIDCL
ncbi:hypothetical protein F4859DRAFT_508816 [Xylaria cf. heliscus]|nr:hypothetical protein F4859DRAFT_508816 [Xylaria cf. heliscus]